MRIMNIQYPTSLDKIEDIYNDNIDVIVTLEDGISYVIVVSTPQNHYRYMDKEEIDYIPPSPPHIMVRSLTEENVRTAVEAFAESDAYWLKVYFLLGDRDGIFDMSSMNKMLDEIKKSNDEILDLN
ncbi:hypothetical protein [Saccharibacillus brassicae]|uniref:Uncharacterized protein n=1 Tax=Saccharibacillus brassicae TaxID=2583377 RepID=A0A4Y6UVR3_SACBS|nr:hypothetical protein [Saccharibacillus brassicae]QDH21832.1 hypothetical protein FFV09_13845 [Saccharibacillus brassicae]